MNLCKYIHIYNPHSELLREMSDFRAGAGNRQDEPRASYNAKSLEVLRKEKEKKRILRAYNMDA